MPTWIKYSIFFCIFITTYNLNRDAIAEEKIQFNQTLSLAADIWPPFTDALGRKRIAIDLVEEGLFKAGLTASTEIMSFSTALDKLNADDADGLVAAWYTSEREKNFVFSRPYLENRLFLLGKSSKTNKVQRLQELTANSVAVVKGYDYGEENKLKVFKRYPDIIECVRALLKDEVSYLLADELVIREIRRHLPESNPFTLYQSDDPMLNRSLHFAVRKTLPDAQKIIERFNSAMSELMVSGSYNRILGMEWILADTDEDGSAEWISAGLAQQSLAGAGLDTAMQQDLSASQNYRIFSSTKAGQKAFYVNGQRFDNWKDAQTALKNAPQLERKSNIQELDFSKVLKEF